MENVQTTGSLSELYSRGYGLRKIAALTGKSVSGIRRELQKLNVYRGMEREPAPAEPNPCDLRQWRAENCQAYFNEHGGLVDFSAAPGALVCPVPVDMQGKLVRLAVKINPTGQFGRVVLGFRSPDGHVRGNQLTLTKQSIASEWHVKGRAEPGDMFCLAADKGESITVAGLQIEQLPEPPALPSADLLSWTCEHGALVDAVRHGWRLQFADEQSRVFTTFAFDRELSLSLECFLAAPHAGVVGLRIKQAEGDEGMEEELRLSDQPVILRCHANRCQGETTLELRGHAPFYALAPLVVLVRNVKLTGEEGETVSLSLPADSNS